MAVLVGAGAVLLLAGCGSSEAGSAEFYPVGAGEELLDENYLTATASRDFLRPIYDPEFVAAEVAKLEPLDIVMGLEINGDARVYPVRILNAREMVDDVVGEGRSRHVVTGLLYRSRVRPASGREGTDIRQPLAAVQAEYDVVGP
jgi:hypothetical protein